MGQYFGPVGHRVFIEGVTTKSIEEAGDRVYEMICDKTIALGGNAIVSLELTFDPFAEQDGTRGLEIFVRGTAAHLDMFE